MYIIYIVKYVYSDIINNVKRTIEYKKSEEKEIKMNYLVENNYTEETKSFLTECQAYNYMYEEIERLNNNYNEDCWSKEDFKLYKFDADNWKWREIKIKVA